MTIGHTAAGAPRQLMEVGSARRGARGLKDQAWRWYAEDVTADAGSVRASVER